MLKLSLLICISVDESRILVICSLLGFLSVCCFSCSLHFSCFHVFLGFNVFRFGTYDPIVRCSVLTRCLFQVLDGELDAGTLHVSLIGLVLILIYSSLSGLAGSSPKKINAWRIEINNDHFKCFSCFFLL